MFLSIFGPLLLKEFSLCHKLEFIIPISVKPDVVYVLRTPMIFQYEISKLYDIGLHVKIKALENQSLWQRLLFFTY